MAEKTKDLDCREPVFRRVSLHRSLDAPVLLDTSEKLERRHGLRSVVACGSIVDTKRHLISANLQHAL
jgi:hypothetical protein